MKRLAFLGIILVLLALRWNALRGQSYVMTDGQTVVTCSGTFYDPGGPDGNYGNNMNVTQTFVPASPGMCLTVTFTSFRLEAGYYGNGCYDYLVVYDGPSTSSPLIGSYCGYSPPAAITSTSGALTFEFHSDGSVVYPGWSATFSCEECVTPEPVPEPVPVTYLTVCPDSVIVITADSAQSYSWSTGETTRSIAVSTPGLYTVTQTNTSGTWVGAYQVSAIITNPVNSISIPGICAGDSYLVTVGHDSASNLQISTHESVKTWADTVFLPDGVSCDPYGCSYRSPLTFTGFSDDDVVNSADDILYVRLNIEHSYAGDLYINLTCPNGQKADIMRYAGNGSSSCSDNIPASSVGWQAGSNAMGSTFFGQAYDYYSGSSPCDPSLSLNAPGYGWNYCWSDNTTAGFTYAPGAGSLIYRSVNANGYPAAFPTIYGGNVTIFDSSDVAAGTQFYHPDQSFSSLVGCPLNGDWYIEVMDGYTVDNGYLFEWELAFSSGAQAQYADVVSTVLQGPWVETLDDSSFVVSPPADLPQDTAVAYTFHCFDELGCQFDTTVFFNFHPAVHQFRDTVVCDSLLWNDSLYTQSFTHTDSLTSQWGCDSIVTFHATVLYSSHTDWVATVCDNMVWNDITYYESGDYTYITQNQSGCDSVVTLHLTVYHSDSVIVQEFACDSLLWNGSIYYESGDYVKHYVNSHGCDSMVTLRLTILGSDSLDFYLTSCDSLEWDNVTYYGSGDYVLPLQKVNGCDSMMTLHFTIWHSDYKDVYDSVCDFYVWDDEIYYESGDYNIYYQNVHGCDSVVALHLTIWPTDFVDIYDTACDSYVWNGITYYESGEYPMPFTNIHGCDSIVTLHLTMGHSQTTELYETVCDSLFWNDSTYYESGDYIYITQASNGCDSLVTLHLAVHYSDRIVLFDTACGSYVWNDSVYDASGTYVQYFHNADFCDSAVTLHLTVWNPDTVEITETACDSLAWNDATYYESGDYVQHFLNANGCDSMVILHLSLQYSDFTEWYDTVCDSLVWNGSVCLTTGDYQQTFQNAGGCDSVVLLHLTVLHSSWTDLYDTTCDSYVWHDSTYYESGEYIYHLQNVEGCDSVVTLHLTIHHSDYVYDERAACDSLVWNDSIYYESGDYIFSYSKENGCDSTVVLRLVIMSTTPIIRYESVCDSLVWDDSTYYESGEYVQTFPSVEGCDSVVTLVLTVANTVYAETYIETCDSLEWNGTTYYETGDYVVILENAGGCDSVVTLHLTVKNTYYSEEYSVVCNSMEWHDSVYYESGDYTLTKESAGGCDSVMTLHLTVNTAKDTLVALTIYENALPYTLNGYTYDAAGLYLQTLTTAEGCDSMLYLQLSVLHPDTALTVYPFGVDNTHCDGLPANMGSVTCNGHAFVSVAGGFPPYTYQWDDPLAQQTDTAILLCAGGYTVTVTDASGATVTAQVNISDLLPKVDHDDARFCYSDTFGVLQGSPAGGTYTGASMSGDTLHFLEDVTAYQMTYTYSDEHSCTASTQFQVTVTMNTRSEDTVICSSYLPYWWYGQPLTTTGTYTKTTPKDTLCDSLIVLHLTVLQQPQLTVSEDVVIDPGENTTLSVSGAGSYLWTPASSLSSATSDHPIASPSQSTQYQVTGFVEGDCLATDSVKVLVRQYLDTILCENNMPLQWYGISIADTTAHTVTVPVPDGLDKVLVLQVHLLRNTSSSVQDTVMENDLPLVFNGIAFDDDVADSMVVIPNSIGCDSVIHFSLYVCRNKSKMVDSVVCESDLPLFWNHQNLYEEDIYRADLQTICGSDSVVFLNLSVIDTALSVISPTEDFCEGMSAELSAITELTDYMWSTGEITPQITVTQPGLYSVTAYQGLCRNSGSIMVEKCDDRLMMPNAISPSNADGLNDCFSVPGAYLRFINLFEIEIFDRWGELVFRSTDKHFNWNGECKGEIHPNTVYNYVIRYTSEAGTPFVVRGSVTVL